ncbi:MAG: DUF2974 domain-containing protein [Verrucomicrobia bacterium]|nr:DUF2974 domain-containing protein [Verrucomicrobiota bacterium]
MPNVVELAHLCAASYEDITEVLVPVLPGAGAAAGSSSAPPPIFRPSGICSPPPVDRDSVWRRAGVHSNRAGYHASLYVKGDQRVIAFRGTDDLMDTLVDDVSITAGLIPPQAIAAARTVGTWVGTGNTYLTGHSLGGALAILSTTYFNRPCVSFNAPGVRDLCVRMSSHQSALDRTMSAVSRCVNNPRVLNIRVDGDPVSSFFTTGFQAGGDARSYSGASCGLDALCRHGIRTCINAVSGDPRNYQELRL